MTNIQQDQIKVREIPLSAGYEGYNALHEYWNAVVWRLAAVVGTAHDGSPSMEDEHVIYVSRSNSSGRVFQEDKSAQVVTLKAHDMGNNVLIDIGCPEEIPGAILHVKATRDEVSGQVQYDLLTTMPDKQQGIMELMRILEGMDILYSAQFSCNNRMFGFTGTEDAIEICEQTEEESLSEQIQMPEGALV